MVPNDDLVCYVNNVSHLKEGSSGNYFTCNLKYGDNEYINGLVYSPDKQKIFQNYENEKSPIKITNYTVSNKYATPSVLMNFKSKFNEIENPTFDPDPTSNSGVIDIINLSKLAPEQLVSVKGQIIKVSSIKKVILSTNSISKQEIEIADPTSTIKVVLWEKDCSQSYQQGETYLFQNFRLKVREKIRYLNSPKFGGSAVVVAEAYDKEVSKSNGDGFVNREEVVELFEIENITKYYSCTKCRRKIDDEDDTVLQCSCGNTMKKQKKKSMKQNVSSSWMLKLNCVRETDDEVLRLTMFTFCLKKLLPGVNLEEYKPKDLSKYLLKHIDTIKVEYDAIKNIVIDVEKV